MTPTVCVHRRAFEAMIRASITTFKKECLGSVFGKRPTKKNPSFVVASAEPLQDVHCFHDGARLRDRSEERLKEFFRQMPLYSQPLGDFHSHTEWGQKRYRREMSKRDIESMAHQGMQIEFIIAIYSSKRSRRWEAHADGSVRGSFCGKKRKYYFSVNAYILEYRDNEPVPIRIKIIAPEAIRALNRALRYSS